MAHHYTQEEFEFIEEHAEGRTKAEITALFNAHFGTDLTEGQIKGFMNRRWITSGLDCRFKPGLTPWNTGKRGISYPGMVPTQFKKGNRPANWVPLGSERVNADGYVDVKVADGQLQHNWRGKHIVIWEAANGPLPPGHAVIFGDGDNRNFEPENLLLVTRKQLARLNQGHLIQDDADLTRTGILVAGIQNKMGERRRGMRRSRREADQSDGFVVYVPRSRRGKSEAAK